MTSSKDTRMTQSDLELKLMEFGTPQVVKEGTVFTVLITGVGLSKWENVDKISTLILEYASDRYPMIEIMKNDTYFFCLILRKAI